MQFGLIQRLAGFIYITEAGRAGRLGRRSVKHAGGIAVRSRVHLVRSAHEAGRLGIRHAGGKLREGTVR